MWTLCPKRLSPRWLLAQSESHGRKVRTRGRGRSLWGMNHVFGLLSCGFLLRLQEMVRFMPFWVCFHGHLSIRGRSQTARADPESSGGQGPRQESLEG